MDHIPAADPRRIRLPTLLVAGALASCNLAVAADVSSAAEAAPNLGLTQYVLPITPPRQCFRRPGRSSRPVSPLFLPKVQMAKSRCLVFW